MLYCQCCAQCTTNVVLSVLPMLYCQCCTQCTTNVVLPMLYSVYYQCCTLMLYSVYYRCCTANVVLSVLPILYCKCCMVYQYCTDNVVLSLPILYWQCCMVNVVVNEYFASEAVLVAKLCIYVGASMATTHYTFNSIFRLRMRWSAVLRMFSRLPRPRVSTESSKHHTTVAFTHPPCNVLWTHGGGLYQYCQYCRNVS